MVYFYSLQYISKGKLGKDGKLKINKNKQLAPICRWYQSKMHTGYLKWKEKRE